MAELQFDLLGLPIPDFLCGLGIFFLSLCYLMTSLCFPLFWKQRDINQCRGRVKRRRKGGTYRGWRTCQREAEERRKLLSMLESHLGQHHAIIHFRHLLCPDPLCEVCNRASAMVHRLLLPECLDDASSAASSSSTSSVIEPSFPVTSTVSAVPSGDAVPDTLSGPSPGTPSIISPKPATPLSDFLSLSPLGDSVPPEPISPLNFKSPEDHFSSQPLAIPGPQSHGDKRTVSIVHAEAALSMVSHPGESSTYIPTTSSTDASSLAMSGLSQWQAPTRNVIFPGLQHGDFQQAHVSHPPPRTCFCRDFDTTNMDVSSLFLLGLNIKSLSETQTGKGMAFGTLEKKENMKETLSSQMGSEHHLTSSGDSLLPLVQEQDATATKSGLGTEGNPAPLCLCQQLLYVKNLGEHLKQKYSQLFWGLPSLHSESLVATVLVSRSSSSFEHHFVLFNGSCNAFALQIQEQNLPHLPHVHTLPLTNPHHQHFPQSKLQPQILSPAHVHSHAQVQCPFTLLPSSSPQIEGHRVSFHRLHRGADSFISNENQQLEWHGFQKQESLWDLVPGLQKCQELPSSPDSNFPLLRQPSQTPVSVFPDHFHIDSGHQERLELRVPKRLTPCCCAHVHRSQEFPALTEPQCNSTGTVQQNFRHAHPQLSELQCHRSKDAGNMELPIPGSFHERVHTSFQLRKDMAKNLGNILGRYSLDNPATVSECYPVKTQQVVSETKNDLMRDDSTNELRRVSRRALYENQMKSILRLHLKRKFWQISEGRIPLLVCRSWLAGDDSLPLPQSYHVSMQNGHLAPVVHRTCYQITTFVLSFLDPKTQQVLEAHIIRFQLNQKWGLPLKVLESIKLFTTREAKTWALPQLGVRLSATHIPGMATKANGSKSLDKSSKSLHGDKVETKSPAPGLNFSLPATSPVGKEGQEYLRQSPADASCVLSGKDETVGDGRGASGPLSHRIFDKASQKQAVTVKREGPEQPAVQAEAGCESRCGKVRFSDHSERVDVRQEKKMQDEDSEHFSTSNMHREMFKARDLPLFPLQAGDSLTITNAQRKTVTPSAADIPSTSEHSPPGIPGPEEPALHSCKEQLLRELKLKFQSGDQSQSQDCPSDASIFPDSVTSDSSLSDSYSVSSSEMADSQVLHFHWKSKGSGLVPHQELWDHDHILRGCLRKNTPPAERRLCPKGLTAGERRCEDTGLGTSRAVRRRHLAEDGKLEGTFETLSQREPHPPESYFRRKMRQFFQWLSPKRNSPGQEIPEKDRALFMSCGPPEAYELMAALGKILEDTLACKRGLEALQLNQQKEDLQAQAEPCRRQLSHCRVPSDLWWGERPCPHFNNQEAGYHGSSCPTRARQTSDRIRCPQKVVAFKDRQLFCSHPCSQPAENW